MIHKAIFKKMINLIIKKIIFTINIIDLDAEISAAKIIVALVFEINNGNIYIIMTLINQDIIMLL